MVVVEIESRLEVVANDVYGTWRGGLLWDYCLRYIDTLVHFVFMRINIMSLFMKTPI